MPNANQLTVGLMAVIAQEERAMISRRTKAALAAAKARGTVLGKPANLSNQALGSRNGNATKSDKAQKHAEELAPVIRDIRNEGHTSLGAIGAELNGRGFPAVRGGFWTAVQVSRVLARLPQSAA